MPVVLLLCCLTLTAIGVWATRRRIEVRAWDRELAAVFDADDRPEIPRHPVL